MTLAVNLPIYLAAGSIHLPRFNPIQFLNTVKAQKPSAFPAQPAMIESLVWNPTLAKYGFPPSIPIGPSGLPCRRRFWKIMNEKPGGESSRVRPH